MRIGKVFSTVSSFRRLRQWVFVKFQGLTWNVWKYICICVNIKLLLQNIFRNSKFCNSSSKKKDNLEKRLNQQTNTTCLLIQNLNDWFQLVFILTPMKQKFSKIVHTYCIIVHNQSIFWLIPFHKIKVYILHNSESAKVLVPWYLNTYIHKYKELTKWNNH